MRASMLAGVAGLFALFMGLTAFWIIISKLVFDGALDRMAGEGGE